MAANPTRTLATFIGAMLAILAVILVAGIGGIASVDVIRSYASGGTQYAQGHLAAVAALRRYAVTGDETDFYRYRAHIHVPASDRIAREILEEPDLDARNSYPFLIGGKIHPADTAGVALLFRTFSDNWLLKPAIELWRLADREVQQIDALADRLRHAVRNTPSDTAIRSEILRQIDRSDARLIELEDRFSWQLGEAARQLTALLYGSLSALGLVLAMLVLGLGYRTHLRLKAAHGAVREREERFRDVAELAAGWIWETDDRLRFTYLSRGLEAVVGGPVEHFLGKSREELSRFDNPQALARHLGDLAAHKPFQDFEYVFRHPDGGIRHFRLNGKPLFDERGRFTGYRGTGSDVTQEVMARREADQQHALLLTTFENMTQGISVIDADLNVLAFNHRFLELLDFPPGRFKPGDPFETFIRYNAERGEYGDGDVDQIVAGVMALARRFESHSFERVRPNGTVLEVRGVPLPSGGFVTTYTDITERRNADHELQAAKTAAETANHAKSAFLANMSHELRTPLNAVIGFADLMAEQTFGPLGERYIGYARDIRQSGQHLLAVINDILDITRVEAGKIELCVEPLDLRQAVQSCLRLLQQRAAEFGVTLRNAVPETAPALHADPQRLRQIVLNLVGNAMKFSEPGSEVVVQYACGDGEHGLGIVDRGIGIAPEQIERAFEPFAQLNTGFDRKYEGAGLGLPLVRRFMELHGGRISIESQTGHGTTATILFPLRPSDVPTKAELSDAVREVRSAQG